MLRRKKDLEALVGDRTVEERARVLVTKIANEKERIVSRPRPVKLTKAKPSYTSIGFHSLWLHSGKAVDSFALAMPLSLSEDDIAEPNALLPHRHLSRAIFNDLT